MKKKFKHHKDCKGDHYEVSQTGELLCSVGAPIFKEVTSDTLSWERIYRLITHPSEFGVKGMTQAQYDRSYKRAIKAFLSAQISLAIKKERERVIEEVEKELKKYEVLDHPEQFEEKGLYVGPAPLTEHAHHEDIGFRSGLKWVLSKLKK